jgi:tetratricopeptide (TPR) repeat protein
VQMDKLNEAKEVHKQLLVSASGHNLIDRAKFHNQMGIIMVQKEDRNTALLHFEKALNIRQELLPLNHPDLAISHNNIGLFYELTGEYLTTLHILRRRSKSNSNLFRLTICMRPLHTKVLLQVNQLMGDYSTAHLHHKKALTKKLYNIS